MNLKPTPRHESPTPSLSRRKLIQSAAAVGAMSALGLGSSSAQAKPTSKGIKKGTVILFQGDSITDAGRKKDVTAPNDAGALGRGYPALVAGELLSDYPDEELQIYNRGISGNKVPDLAGRWDRDAIELKPDILSIKIGVNDYWHTIAFGNKYTGTVDDYEEGYRELIQRTQKEIRGVRIVICDPFTLRDWEPYKEYQARARKLADEFDLTWVPLQEVFDKALEAAPSKFWAGDAVHPSSPGHALIAQAWREAVGI
jgi:lysophospholipase L1-like esterase